MLMRSSILSSCVVVEMMNRYIAVCRPFHRRIICTRNFARRAIATVLLLAALVSIHKPLLSGVYDVTAPPDVITAKTPAADRVTSTNMTYRDSERDDDESWTWITANNGNNVSAMLVTSSGDRRVCTRNPEYSWKSSFITEIVYGLSITVVPFVPIIVLNAAILRALVTRDRLTATRSAAAELSSSGPAGNSSSSRLRYKTVEKRVRREFTVILLVICASVLCLSLPYFVVWCRQYLQSRHAEDPATAHWIRDKLFATKTVFYVSYSINFILYSLAGANYRNAVAALCHPCCPSSGRFQPPVTRRTTPGIARRLSASTMGPSSESGSAACAAIAVEPRQIAVSAV